MTKILRADFGFSLDSISEDYKLYLKRQLSILSKPWRDNPAIQVDGFYEDSEYLWIPRHYALSQGFIPDIDQRTPGDPIRLDLKIKLDPSRGQTDAVPKMVKYLQEKTGGILIAGTGIGKCLGKGTPVMLATGEVIPVEKVQPGDKLMGPDGEIRKVKSTSIGHGPLYKITPVKGEPWICNKDHILTLVKTGVRRKKAPDGSKKDLGGNIIDVPLSEWLSWSKGKKQAYKQYSVGVAKFHNGVGKPTIDPYFLGVWFGDGTKTLKKLGKDQRLVVANVQISNTDQEIFDMCDATAKDWSSENYVLSAKNYVTSPKRCPSRTITSNEGKSNLLLDELRESVGSDIKIPTSILYGSKTTRRKFLAGFIDSDGYYHDNCYTISQKREDWARNIWWIARSLGLFSTIRPVKKRDQNGTEGLYYSVIISGDVDILPVRIPYKKAHPRKQKKNALRTGISVESIGNGDYYGFELDGDGRFLLGDFTVTHNTLLSYAIASHFNTSIGVLVYAGHMIDNWIEQAVKTFDISKDDIGVVQKDSCPTDKPITLFSVQSLLVRDYPKEVFERIGFLIADESPRYSASEWSKVTRLFPGKYRLTISADPKRKDGLDAVLNWNFGHIGHQITAQPAQISIMKVHVDTDYPFNSYKSWKPSPSGDFLPDPLKYDKKLAKDSKRNKILVDILLEARKPGKRKILVFSRLKDHLKTLKESFDQTSSDIKDFPKTTTSYLIGQMKEKDRELAKEADIIFSTYAYARDALNITTIDTEVFATPPGDPLQPAGRLRDKGAEGRQPLMLVDIHESGDYSISKWNQRRRFYASKNFTIKEFYRKA